MEAMTVRGLRPQRLVVVGVLELCRARVLLRAARRARLQGNEWRFWDCLRAARTARLKASAFEHVAEPAGPRYRLKRWTEV
jgi:hypothetical protein